MREKLNYDCQGGAQNQRSSPLERLPVSSPPPAALSPEEGQPPHRFGTFLGVFTPSVLTILGVMMYLRFGWVLANAGLPGTLLILTMASGITFITGLSAAAIATNMRVGVGGEYFMISRSLGLEIGGAIGIPLFLCRTLSFTLYAFGLAESLAFLWPVERGPFPLTWVAAGLVVVITLLAGKSAELTLKLQLPIMLAVGASLVALAAGVFGSPLGAPELEAHFERSAPEGFWYVFAVFFPAVTGFTTGIGMSGDLKDPKRSIPKGTILAVLTGYVIYAGILLLLAINTRVPPEAMARLDPSAPPVWTGIALLGFWFVYPGMWGAILSSAFGSALAGPRVLQALARDGLAPGFLARTTRSGQPLAATLLTGLMALGAVRLGDLNTVGRWVTIFFLTLYIAVNLSAAIEKLVGDPSFRPTIRVPWPFSLLGCLGAAVVMYLMNPTVCLIALGAELGLFLLLRRKALSASWGDARAGLWNAAVRLGLMKLREMPRYARNWRPHILVLTANPTNRTSLVRLANWFNQNRGVVTVCQVVVGDPTTTGERRTAMEAQLNRQLAESGTVAFGEVVVVPEFASGVATILQANGYAGLHSNTAMFGWPADCAGLARILHITRLAARVEKSTLIVRESEALEASPDRRRSAPRRIDIWWRGKEINGDLMLLLAYLLTCNPTWVCSQIVVRSICEEDEDKAALKSALAHLVEETRIRAETDVVVRPPKTSVRDLMHVISRDAEVVFLGLKEPTPEETEVYAERLWELAEGFKTTVFVRNAGQFVGELI